MSHWPLHARIEGAIVMIGFGSIGKGTLPLIERHFEFDKEHFVVIDPNDSDRRLLDERGVKFVHLGLTRDNYRDALGKYLKAGKGQGFCVNLSVDTSSLDIMRYCREIGALYIDTVVEPWPGLLLRQVARQRGAHQLCAARDGDGGAAQESGRNDRGLLLRRQSGHGLLVRQAGARQSRGRPRRQGRRAEVARGLGQARPAPRRQGRAYRRARHPARDTSEAAQRLRQHLVDRGFPVGRHAAGRTWLGHAREMGAGQCGLP